MTNERCDISSRAHLEFNFKIIPAEVPALMTFNVVHIFSVPNKQVHAQSQQQKRNTR